MATNFVNASFGQVRDEAVKNVNPRKSSGMPKVISKGCGAMYWNIAQAHSLKL